VGRLYATKSTQPFFVFTIPSNLKKIYNGIECSDSGAGISFNASLINLIKDTINLATLSQKTKGQSSDASEILSLAEPIQRLTIDMENLRLNGNETFSELVLRRIFSNIYAIQSKIYTFRGVQVMLDKDLADFYQVKPIRLREKVKRNPNRFPNDFVFQLINDEIEYLVSQNAIPSKKVLGGI
jgi:hypothetical protein